MNKLVFSLVAASVMSMSAGAATIGKVICRQQWPWSANINVEYLISDVSGPVDIKVQCFNGGVELSSAVVHNASDRHRHRGAAHTRAFRPPLPPTRKRHTCRAVVQDAANGQEQIPPTVFSQRPFPAPPPATGRCRTCPPPELRQSRRVRV